MAVGASVSSPRRLPCVVYLHGNSSCRLDVTQSRVLEVTIKAGYSLCAFDFAACGRSEGDYISLGLNESYDVDAVVNHM